MKKVTVGQELWAVPAGNNRIKEKYLRVTVAKVGRKYFEVSGLPPYRDTKFYVEDMREYSDYSPNWYLHLSEQAILDEREIEETRIMLEKSFSWNACIKNRLTLDQLRRIKAILEEG